MKMKRDEKFFKKRSLGQNFLVNKGVLALLIETADIAEKETVLEIGAGKGTLTVALLSAGAEVVTVEKDDRLIPILKEKFKKEIGDKRLTIVHGDILEMNLQKIIPQKSYKVVANIPYYITGALIRFLLSSNHSPKEIVLMLQKEVAKRIVAKDSKENLLSLSIKVYGVPQYIKTVSRGSFSPPPNVDSAILYVKNISKKFFDDIEEDFFFAIIRTGFSQKRKLLFRNLEQKLKKESLERAFADCNLSPLARAEDLTLQNWGCLAKCVQNSK